jgi:hypothetical protein
MTLICYLWSNANVLWKNANWLWSECFNVPDTGSLATPGVDASTLVPPWIEEPWNPYKSSYKNRKRLLKLICRINGLSYKDEKEKNINVSLTVKEMNFVVDKQKTNVEINLGKQ